MKDFKKLAVWQCSHRLALAVYGATKSFPSDELYGLTTQARRAASSVPANIAEGCGREGDSELARYLNIAMGSASELQYHLLLAHDLGLLDDSVYTRLDRDVTEVKRMLGTFIRKLKADSR